MIDDDVEVLGELKGKSFNTVTLWDCANARAYRVALKDLEGVASVDRYSVEYTVDPVGAADIKGAAHVNAGEDLYFDVTPQVGYELVSVTANGEELEAVATVDENGKVTAVGQGEAVITAVANDASHAYAEQAIVVYSSKPVTQTVQVWVTNRDQGGRYTFNLPTDGTIVNVDKVFKEVEGFETTGKIRVGNWVSANTPSWSRIEAL